VSPNGHEYLPPSPGYGLSDSPYYSTNPEDRAAWLKLCNLQRRILPQVAPVVPGYRLALAYRPAFVVTGDYHDFFRRADGQTATFLGDGSGHGPAASMLMAIMRTILNTHPHHDPGETLGRAGSIFQRLVPDDMFMTGLYLLLEPGGRVHWAAAGHHPPLWLNHTGRVAPTDLDTVGPVLGLSTEPYTTITWDLAVGDRLLLFTDGLWEARSSAGEPFGRRRLIEQFSRSLDIPLADVVNGLTARVASHLAGADFEDDFTILGIERVN
jgi:sigma-B regulation protein RsbU (phosphoserine phosphatase)